VSCTNLGRLLPVVEQMGRAYCMSTWKLDPATLKFLLKVQLPYHTVPVCSVVHPNQLSICEDPDPDPGSHVRSDPDPAGIDQDLNKFGFGSDLSFSNFLQIKAFPIGKMLLLGLKVSS